MKKYTLEDIKKLPAMQMEDSGWSNSLDNWKKRVKNQLRHQLLKELKQ